VRIPPNISGAQPYSRWCSSAEARALLLVSVPLVRAGMGAPSRESEIAGESSIHLVVTGY
jgi:hypothetical protein